MNKLLEAIKKMISNPDKITEVRNGNDENEIFFTYKDKYTWSLLRGNTGKWIYYYPNDKPSKLKNVFDWDSIEMKSYNLTELGDEEGNKLHDDLFLILETKVYNVDSVLDDILAD